MVKGLICPQMLVVEKVSWHCVDLGGCRTQLG